MRKLSSADRSALIKLASSLPAGSSERKAILAGLQGSSKTAKSLRWSPVVGDALEKVTRVFEFQLESEFDDLEGNLYATKVGRKTVFARDYGSVIRLYVAGDDGYAYSKKYHTGISNIDIQSLNLLLSAASIGLTPESEKDSVYKNGPISR